MATGEPQPLRPVPRISAQARNLRGDRGIALALGLALAIALAMGLIAAAILGPLPGLSTAGLVVAWVAWKTGDVDQLIRVSQSGRPLTILAIEGAIFGPLAVLAVYLIVLAGRRRDAEARAPRLWAGPSTALAVGVSLFAAGVGAWFIGISLTDGPTFVEAGTQACAGAQRAAHARACGNGGRSRPQGNARRVDGCGEHALAAADGGRCSRRPGGADAAQPTGPARAVNQAVTAQGRRA